MHSLNVYNQYSNYQTYVLSNSTILRMEHQFADVICHIEINLTVIGLASHCLVRLT